MQTIFLLLAICIRGFVGVVGHQSSGTDDVFDDDNDAARGRASTAFYATVNGDGTVATDNDESGGGRGGGGMYHVPDVLHSGPGPEVGDGVLHGEELAPNNGGSGGGGRWNPHLRGYEFDPIETTHDDGGSSRTSLAGEEDESIVNGASSSGKGVTHPQKLRHHSLPKQQPPLEENPTNGGFLLAPDVEHVLWSSYLFLGHESSTPLAEKGTTPDNRPRVAQHVTLPFFLDVPATTTTTTTTTQLSSSASDRHKNQQRGDWGVSLWVNVSPTGNEIGSKTLLSSRPSGGGRRCNERQQQQQQTVDNEGVRVGGVNLYINHALTADEELVLEYTAPSGECGVMSSVGFQVPVGVWTHVGVTVASYGGEICLYINGREVAFRHTDDGDSDMEQRTEAAKGASVLPPGSSQAEVLDNRSSTSVGQNEGGGDVLNGAVAMMAFWFLEYEENEGIGRGQGEPRKNDDNDYLRRRMELAYEAGLDHWGLMAGSKPTFLYTFESEDEDEEGTSTDGKEAAPLRELIQAKSGSITYIKPTRAHEFAYDDGVVSPRVNATSAQFNKYAEYKDGDYPPPRSITQSMKDESDKLGRIRSGHVRDAMVHAWKGYRQFAWGYDELLPLSHAGQDCWGGMGTTLVDSLDTLWLMGLKDEFWEGRDWVRDELNHDDVHGMVSVFETTIRSLGGLLSAYDLSGDVAFLQKADDLGERLVKAFNSRSGIPYPFVPLGDGPPLPRHYSLLAEAGTLQVEFRYLARATGKTEYGRKAERVFELLEPLQPPNGLFPTKIINSQQFPQLSGRIVSFGAEGDSMFEYMLKVWLQGGRKETMYRNMYEKAIQGVHDHLIQRSKPSGLTYIAEMHGDRLVHNMDHLACFMGGLLALGAYTHPDGIDSPLAQRDLKTGKALAYTCYQMYARMPTGLSPERVKFQTTGEKDQQRLDFVHDDPKYILRPETAETLFILNQLTGDPIYREWGWEIFVSIERFCKTDAGYGSLPDVTSTDRGPEDKMESFFLSETLKYLYLLQEPDAMNVSLYKQIFNTEAHPLRAFD